MGLCCSYAIPKAADRDFVLPHQDIVPIDIASGKNRDDAAFSFEKRIPHGRTIRIGIQESMAVDPAMSPIFMGQYDDGLVFGGDARVPAACFRIHRINLAKQKPGGIHMMDESHLDEQPGFLPEIGLLRVGFVAQPVAPSETGTRNQSERRCLPWQSFHAPPGTRAASASSHESSAARLPLRQYRRSLLPPPSPAQSASGR